MFFQQYPAGQYPPEKVNEFWCVHCELGALEVLRKREYDNFLSKYPNRFYLIPCASSSYLSVKPGDALWGKLAEVAKNYKVEVFPLSYAGTEYKEWTGKKDDCQKFDVISISKR